MMVSLANGLARRYFTFFVWNETNSAWEDEFGDYSKKYVKEELKEHSAPKKFKQIVEHDDSSVAMMAARDSLEPPKGYVHNFVKVVSDNPWVNSIAGMTE